MRSIVLVLLLTMELPAQSGPKRVPRDQSDFFERSVRPILVERCVGCHGAKKARGALRLDTRDGLLRGGDGGRVIDLEKPQSSRLLKAIRHEGPLKMPEANRLPDREITILEKWLELGAPWPENSPIVVPSKSKQHWAFQPIRKPTIPAHNQLQPIDYFIQLTLNKNRLKPSPAADRRTLIRRMTFDLHGLPPTPDEIESFVNDPESNAEERLIDRLLASPRYGERWGRHWLDVARYADNKGYIFFEQQEYPWAWTYRDYVIDALNRDVPYDRFLMEQMAADHVAPDQPRTLAALGFLTVGGHFMNNTHDVIDDRIDVVTRGLMGLTVSCARCHDHKFDPIPASDYYALYGVFRSCNEPRVPPLLETEPETKEYKSFKEELEKKESALRDFVTKKHSDLVLGARTRAGEYLWAVWKSRDQPPADDFMLIADPGDLNPTMITRWRVYLETQRKKPNAVWSPWFAFADAKESEFPAVAKRLSAMILNRLVKAAFDAPPKTMKDVADRYGQLFSAAEKQGATEDPDGKQIRDVLYGPASPANAPLELDWGFLSLFPDRATQATYQKLLKELETHLTKGPPRAMVLLDSTRPFEPRIFERGHPNRLGVTIPRQFLSVFGEQKPFQSGSGRYELAKAITSPDNPLTARVIVNRVWMHHFGVGLVATPGDFGTRGDPPSHPELLDWLAADFMEHGWSLKKLHRQLMRSRTYQQISTQSEQNTTCSKADPENRLLWRMNPRKLEFEALHDSLLAVSGSLDLKQGGPPVKLLTGAHRRAVYGFVNRLDFPSLWSSFDVPAPTSSISNRLATTTAPQALFMLNGAFTREAAKSLISKMPQMKNPEGNARVDDLFRSILGRPPTNDERDLAIAFVSQPGENRWIDLAQSLLASNEFLFID